MFDMKKKQLEKVSLGSLLTLKKGKKPKKQSPVKEKGMQPYVDIKAFETGVIDNYTDDDKCLPCNDGDLLIVCDGSRSGYVGRAIKGYTGSTLAKISAEGVDNSYLYYFIQSMYRLLNTQMKGTGTPHLNVEVLRKAELVIPSIPEQKRIVDKIEELFSELDSAVETLKKTKEQLAVYRQSVLKEAFESITETSILLDLAERIFDGPFGSNLKSIDYINEGIRVVRLENLKEGWFDDSKQSFVSNEKYETIKKHTVYPSDLIMSTFISDSIKVCQMPEYIKFAVNKADCIGIRLKEDVVEKKYVLYYLLSRKAYVDLEHQIHGATRPRVNTTQIKQLEIPICSKKEQKKIVSQIESKFTICENIEKTVNDALIQADAMRQSILKKAFEGGL